MPMKSVEVPATGVLSNWKPASFTGLPFVGEMPTGWKGVPPGGWNPPNTVLPPITPPTASSRSAVRLASAIRTRSWTCCTPAIFVTSIHFMLVDCM